MIRARCHILCLPLFMALLLSGCFRYNKVRISSPRAYEPGLLDTCDSKECLQKVLIAEPENVLAHWRLGVKYQLAHEYKDAIREFDLTIKLDPEFNLGYAYRDRANCYNNLGNNVAAVKDMDAALRLNPGERYFYVDRGSYLYNLRSYEKALADFNKALELFDKYTAARAWKAEVLVQLERYAEALKEYELLELDPEQSENRYNIFFRGLAKFHTNDKEGACSDWKSVAATCEPAKDHLNSYCK